MLVLFLTGLYRIIMVLSTQDRHVRRRSLAKARRAQRMVVAFSGGFVGGKMLDKLEREGRIKLVDKLTWM
jgi:hypothetical protein